MSGQNGPLEQWADLPPDCRWAVRHAYQGWQSKHQTLAEAWGRLVAGESLEGLRIGSQDRYRLDWLISRSAVPLTLLEAWHTACAETLSELPETASGRSAAALMLMDSVNMPDLDFGLKAAAAAAARIVSAGGQHTARSLADRLHKSCVPDPRLTVEALAGSRGFVFKGRVYIF